MVGTRPCKTRPDVTVGRILSEARARRGWSLVQVSSVLKIPVQQLEALEKGDVSMFPAEIYARGAFAKYAQYLGVYADNTQRAFLRTLSGAREFVPLRVHTPKPWLEAILTPRLVLAAAMVGIAGLVGSYVAWQVASFVRLPHVIVTEPLGGLVEAMSINVQGKAETEAKVMVNGEQALLAGDGSFSVPLELHSGVNVIRVEATNTAGRVKTVQREVLASRQ